MSLWIYLWAFPAVLAPWVGIVALEGAFRVLKPVLRWAMARLGLN